MIINDYVIINLRLREAGFQFYATNDGNTIIPIDDTNEISTSTPYTITGYMMESDSHVLYVLLSYIYYKDRETHYLKTLLREGKTLTDEFVKYIKKYVEIVDDDTVMLHYKNDTIEFNYKLKLDDSVSVIKQIKQSSKMVSYPAADRFEHEADRKIEIYKKYVKDLVDIFRSADTVFEEDVIESAPICIYENDSFVVKNIVHNFKLHAHLLSLECLEHGNAYKISFTRGENRLSPFLGWL